MRPVTGEPHCSSRASHLPYSSSASSIASCAAEPSERRSPLTDREPGTPDVAATLPDIPVVEPDTEAAEVDATRSRGVGGLLKSSAVMAVGTVASRLLGFIRNAVIVIALGTGPLGDVY